MYAHTEDQEPRGDMCMYSRHNAQSSVKHPVYSSVQHNEDNLIRK